MNTLPTLSDAVDAARDDLIAFLQKMVQASSLPDQEHDVQNLDRAEIEIHGT